METLAMFVEADFQKRLEGSVESRMVYRFLLSREPAEVSLVVLTEPSARWH